MDASLYFDGEVQIRLSQFCSDNPESRYEIKISNMAELLQDPECVLEGYCRSKARDKILRGLNCTPGEWRGMEPGPLNAQLCQELCFVAESALISSVRTALGDEFLCTIRLHCTPPKQLAKLTDGEIFQNVRFYYKNDRAAAAEEWIKTLSGPKQANLISLHGCPAIMDALDRLLRFPGLWFGLQLGNWAKHLAAHVDQCIVNYLSHIYNFYSKIMDGFENMSDQLDEITIAQLQHRSPSWSSQDIAYIEKGFRSGTLFPGIRSSHVRNTVKERIKTFTGIIPSIITFHENMKYLTIGTKILERCIELPRHVEMRRGIRVRLDLFNKLKANWNLDEMKVQADHNAFISSPLPPDADLCCIQLVIAAIRHFASLNVYEAPLMDSDRKTMSATIDLETQGHLCWIATKLGFNDQRIQARASERNPASWPNKSQKPFHTWRAGKPFREVFLYLEQHSFLLQIIQELNTASNSPSPLSVQGDILSAFFNLGQYADSFGGVGSDQPPPGGPSFHTKSSFEAFLKLQDKMTTMTKKDAGKDNRFDKHEPGSSKGHKDKSPPLNPQGIRQAQRDEIFQFTGLKQDTNGVAIKTIRRLQSQRQPTLRTTSLDSTVSGIFFNQQGSRKQLSSTSNGSSEEKDIYSATPRDASPSSGNNDQAGDIFPRHARLASVSSNASGIDIVPQAMNKRNRNASNTSSSKEELHSATPRNASPSSSGNKRAGDMFPRHAQSASVSTNTSIVGVDQQENTNQSIDTTSLSSGGSSYYATPRGSAASSIQVNPKIDKNSAGLSTSTRQAFNHRIASIESNFSGIGIDQLEYREQSVGSAKASSQDGLHKPTSRDSTTSAIQARSGKDDNYMELLSSNRDFEDATSKNGSDKGLEYPLLDSLESLLRDTPVGNLQHTEGSSDVNLNDTQVTKTHSPSLHSPSASISSEPQPSHVQYPKLDSAKAKMLSTSAESSNKEVGLEKKSYDPQQPLPRLSTSLKELKARDHQYNKVTKSSKDGIHVQGPPPPQSSSTREPPRKRRPRPARIYIPKTKHKAKSWLQRLSLDGGDIMDLDVDSGSTNGPEERHSYEDSGSEIANRLPEFPPEKIQLLKDHSPTAIYGRRDYERSYSRIAEPHRKRPRNKSPWRMRLPLSARDPQVPMKYWYLTKNLAYEWPLFSWHKIKFSTEEQLSLFRQEYVKTIKPRWELASPNKFRTFNSGSLQARYNKRLDDPNAELDHSKGIESVDQTDVTMVDQTEDPKVNSNRTSRTESVNFAELSPYNINRDVGSGVWADYPGIDPSADGNMQSSQDDHPQNIPSSNVFTNEQDKSSPPNDYTDIS